MIPNNSKICPTFLRHDPTILCPYVLRICCSSPSYLCNGNNDNMINLGVRQFCNILLILVKVPLILITFRYITTAVVISKRRRDGIKELIKVLQQVFKQML